MFTGIIEEIGTVTAIRRGAASSVLTIEGRIIFEGLKTGDSVAVNGVCLTVRSLEKRAFVADVMHETLNRSSLGTLRAGGRVNLERAMPADGRFGGHIVSGHIDGTGVVRNIRRDDNAVWYTVAADEKILRYIVEKGSVALDGVSLTVVSVSDGGFSVSVIPHTADSTTLSERRSGDVVDIENDLVGKYVEKLLSRGEAAPKSSGITSEFLSRFGF